MGKIKKGVFGEFTGKVGNLVGCTWKGIPYMRTRPANMTNPRTEKQRDNLEQISGGTQLPQNNYSLSTHRIPGIRRKTDCFQRCHVLCDEKCPRRQ